MHQVDDQLELVQALEVGHLGVIAGIDERLEAGLDQLGGASAEHRLLTEQVCLGLILEARLDHAAACAANALGIGECQPAGVAGCILLDRDQAGNTAALEELAAHQVTRPLGRDHADINARRWLDLFVVNREAVAEQQHVALSDAVADLLLPNVVVSLVGQQDHHEIAATSGLDDRQDLEALLARLGDGGGVLTESDDDFHARVLQVQGMGVALGAVADDCDGLAVEQMQVSVVVVEHRRRLSNLRAGGCHEGSPRDIQRAVGGGEGREALGKRRVDLGDLRLGAIEDCVVKSA